LERANLKPGNNPVPKTYASIFNTYNGKNSVKSVISDKIISAGHRLWRLIFYYITVFMT